MQEVKYIFWQTILIVLYCKQVSNISLQNILLTGCDKPDHYKLIYTQLNPWSTLS